MSGETTQPQQSQNAVRLRNLTSKREWTPSLFVKIKVFTSYRIWDTLTGRRKRVQSRKPHKIHLRSATEDEPRYDSRCHFCGNIQFMWIFQWAWSSMPAYLCCSEIRQHPSKHFCRSWKTSWCIEKSLWRKYHSCRCKQHDHWWNKTANKKKEERQARETRIPSSAEKLPKKTVKCGRCNRKGHNARTCKWTTPNGNWMMIGFKVLWMWCFEYDGYHRIGGEDPCSHDEY